MLCYITDVMFYNIWLCHVITYVFMLCYITRHVIKHMSCHNICYITCVMLCYITYVVCCFITYDMKHVSCYVI